MCSSRKYPCSPKGRLMEISRGRGISKALPVFFEGKYDTKMEFPEGWGIQTKKPSVGGVWIFSGTTQWEDSPLIIVLVKIMYIPLSLESAVIHPFHLLASETLQPNSAVVHSLERKRVKEH